MQENWLERVIAMPGAISVIFLLSIFLPIMGWPLELTLPLLISFSVPTLYVFFVMVILNRQISLKKQLPIVVMASLLLYIISRAPATPQSLYVYIFLFLIGLGISTLSYSVYYFFYRLGKRIWAEETMRKMFLIAFLPTLIIMLLVFFLLGGMPIGMEDGEIVTLTKWMGELL